MGTVDIKNYPRRTGRTQLEGKIKLKMGKKCRLCEQRQVHNCGIKESMDFLISLILMASTVHRKEFNVAGLLSLERSVYKVAF